MLRIYFWKNLQQLFEKADRSLFFNVHLGSSFLIVNLKGKKMFDKGLLLFFFQNKIGHIVLLDVFYVFIEFFRLYKTGIYPLSLENGRIHVHEDFKSLSNQHFFL